MYRYLKRDFVLINFCAGNFRLLWKGNYKLMVPLGILWPPKQLNSVKVGFAMFSNVNFHILCILSVSGLTIYIKRFLYEFPNVFIILIFSSIFINMQIGYSKQNTPQNKGQCISSYLIWQQIDNFILQTVGDLHTIWLHVSTSFYKGAGLPWKSFKCSLSR